MTAVQGEAHLLAENSRQDCRFSEDQRKTAIRVANVPADQFEEHVESSKPPTVQALARQGIAASGAASGDAGLGDEHSDDAPRRPPFSQAASAVCCGRHDGEQPARFNFPGRALAADGSGGIRAARTGAASE